MRKPSFKKAPWYPNAIAACIAVVLYVVLSHLPSVCTTVGSFIGYFSPVLLGCVIAFIVNPLANWFNHKLFLRVRKASSRHACSTLLAFFIVLLFLAFCLFLLIPQLIASVRVFVANLDGYVASASEMLESIGVSKTTLDLSSFISSSEDLLSQISEYVTENSNVILSASADAGRIVFRVAMALILAVYLLLDKPKLLKGTHRLLKALLGDKSCAKALVFFEKCNAIFNRYIVFNLIDALIIGAVNAIFMAIFGMEYIGLVSLSVAFTNLVPTFGPIVGACSGSFILLMVKPVHALIFLIFTLLLQFFDGYVLKPRLFGNSLGVSGLWVLVGIIVGGNMLGVTGILLAIPIVAILDFSYRAYLLPYLEARHASPPPPAE